MVSLLQPVARPLALSGRVYEALRANIRNGKMLPGQPLQEVSLAAQLGVSRTPVREALARLANEGLVVSNGRSFAVPALTLTDIDEIYEIRSLIEPEALRRIARWTADPAVRTPIMEALETSKAAHKADDCIAFMAASERFRMAWLSLVSNSYLARSVELYADHVQQVRFLTLDKAKVRTVVLKGLKRIAAALAAGDGDAAAAAMRNHLAESRKAFIAAVGLDRQTDDNASNTQNT